MSEKPDHRSEAAHTVAADVQSMPVARLKPERRLSLAWLLPLGAVALAAWLGYRAWQLRGTAVAVHLEDGYGLKAGDDVRSRGIAVGTIDSIQLEPDLHNVLVQARLTSQAERLARAGSRFWVVRPQLELTRVQGLETLIGPRFLSVIPAADNDNAPRQYHFVGLAEPPMIE